MITMKIVVQKYGGTSVETIEKTKNSHEQKELMTVL